MVLLVTVKQIQVYCIRKKNTNLCTKCILLSALYTIITFPFLFAIMFGDSGHGIIMAMFGFYMVFCEKALQKKKIDNEIWNIFFAGRYIILLMGLFSTYTGFVYNDVFSKSLNLFGTRWELNYTKEVALTHEELTLDPATDFRHYPYFIGLDPIWQV